MIKKGIWGIEYEIRASALLYLPSCLLITFLFFPIVKLALSEFVLLYLEVLVVVLGSCVIHEIGHIIAALLCPDISLLGLSLGMNSEVRFHPPKKNSFYPEKKVLIAIGGPLTHLIILISGFFLNRYVGSDLLRFWNLYNMYLLITNLVPFAGLDGGVIYQEVRNIYQINSYVKKIDRVIQSLERI